MAKFTNELTIDVRPFLEALKKATAAAGGDVKKLEQELSGIEADIKIQADTNQARSAIGQLQAEVAGLGDEQVRVSADTGEARTNTEQLGAEIAGLGGTAAQTGDQIEQELGGSLSSIKSRFGDGFLGGIIGGGVAGAVTSAIGSITNLTGAAFDEYKKLDSSIQNIGTLGVEAAGLSLDRFKELATDLSTSLPDTAGNIANGIYNAISAGITGTEEEIAGFVEVAGKVAVAGLSDTNTAVNALTSVVNAYGLGVEGADEVSNTFFAAIKAGKTSFEELNAGLANVVPAASAAGIGFDEVAGTIAKLTTVGIPTAQATTQLRSAIVELQKPSKPLADALAKIGLNAQNMGAELAKPREEGGGLVNVLQRLQASAAESGQSLTQIFGSAEAASAALALTGANAESTNQILQNVGADIADNVAGKAFEAASQSIDVQFRTIANKLQATFNSIFAALAPVISTVLDKVVNDIFPRLQDAFSRIGSALAPTLAVIGQIFGGVVFAAVEGLVGIIGGLADGFDLIRPVIPAIAIAFGAWAVASNAAAIGTALVTAAQAALNVVMAANPIGLVAVAVVGLVAVLGLLADALEDTAGEQLDAAEAQKEYIEGQIESNKEQQKTVEGTQKLAKRYEELAKKTNRTADETEELQKIQRELDRQYPDLNDQTKTFEENLGGVAEISKRTTGELDGLVKKAGELDKTLQETNRRISELGRDVALEELQDAFGSINFFGGLEENKFRRQLQKRVDEYEKAIRKVNSEEQTRGLTNALLDFVNANGEALGDSKQLLNITNKILAVEKAAANAVRSRQQATEAAAEAAADTPPPPPAPDPDTGGGKAAETALARALKQYEAIEARQKILLAQDLKRIELRRDLSDEERKSLAEIEKAKVATLLQAEAQRVLKANLDQFGLFVSTSLKLVGDETDTRLRQIFNDLAKAAPQIDLIVAPTAPDRVSAVLAEIRPAIPIALEVRDEETDRVETTFQSLQQRLADGLAGLFKTSTDTQAEELDKQELNLKAQLKRNEISYAEYTAKLGEIDAQRTEQATGLGAALSTALGAIGATAAEAAQASFDRVGKSADAAYKLATQGATLSAEETKKLEGETMTTSDTFAELGIAAGATFAGLVADGADAGEALQKTLTETLKAAVKAFIPQIFANYLAFIPPPFNVAAATAAVALLNGLIDQFLGFEEGGLVPGGEKLIRINEAGQEFVMNAKATRKYLPMLEAMNSGRDVSMVGADVLQGLDSRLERVENAIRGLGTEINRRTRIEGELVFSGGAQTLVGTFDTISTYNKRRRLK